MTILMAHRGARDLWAENSLLGFQEVVSMGVPAVEFDLHLTDDGKVLVIHDATLDRTTTGTGAVRSLSDDARQALRLKGPDGEISETVPTFDEVLEIVSSAKEMLLFVELKLDAAGQPYEGLPEAAAASLRRFGLAERAVLTSFDRRVLTDCLRVAPEIPRLISVDRPSAARAGGVAAFFDSLGNLAQLVGVEHQLFETEFDAITARWPLDRLGVWTVNDPALIARWIARSPAYLTTDNPRLASQILVN